MISFLKGEVIIIEKDNITLNVNNVGYQVVVSSPYSYIIGDIIQLYIYTYVKEGQISLFGFKQILSKELFVELLLVKGVGPKTAVTIISSLPYYELVRAIKNNDINTLRKIPGIGLKNANQIILDLKGKINIVNTDFNSSDLNDAIEALFTLGYKKEQINIVIDKLRHKEINTQEYIKEALSLMLK